MDRNDPMTISLPAAMRARVEAVVNSGDYGNTSEYIRELIRNDLRMREAQAVDRKLLDAIGSGASKRFTPAMWAEFAGRLKGMPEERRKPASKKRAG